MTRKEWMYRNPELKRDMTSYLHTQQSFIRAIRSIDKSWGAEEISLLTCGRVKSGAQLLHEVEEHSYDMMTSFAFAQELGLLARRATKSTVEQILIITIAERCSYTPGKLVNTTLLQRCNAKLKRWFDRAE